MPRFDIARFEEAQRRDYDNALAEIRSGRKQSHWIWHIFPQLQGLGRSEMCRYYGVNGLEEATEMLANPYLSAHLIEISQALLDQPCQNARGLLGPIDAKKVRSCMTLFSLVEDADPVFLRVLDKFYEGHPDRRTLDILGVRWPFA